jgi:glycosyltransferase involved in cell wall biosynthesis
MRVLMLSWEYPPHIVGGMGKHVMDLAPALVQAGVTVHVLTPSLRGGAAQEISPEGVHISRIEPPQMQDYSFVSFARQTNTTLEQAARALQGEIGHFDLIHAHDWLVTPAGIALKHAWHRPLVATIHATERGRGQGHISNSQSEQINSLEWWLTYEAWRVIACSCFMADQLNEYFNTPRDKIDVVPNGIYVHPDPFVSPEERRLVRQRFVLNDQPLVFYVGRIVYEKGLHVLLEAWPRVLSVMPRARLLIAGMGDYLETLKRRAWELGIGNQVIFTGFISDEDRDKLYHIADVAVFPSLYEPFGIVALEAMAARCPVIVAETGGLPEVVKPHETGLTVQPNSPEALAWGILHTLQHPDWAHARAENAFREARDSFNWRSIAAVTTDVYQRTYAAWESDSWGAPLAPHGP